MPTNTKLKRYDSGSSTWDILHPETHADQVQNLETAVTTTVSNTYKGKEDGFPVLNSSLKIEDTYFPDYVKSGMHFIGTASDNDNALVQQFGPREDLSEFEYYGRYVIVSTQASSGFTLENPSTWDPGAQEFKFKNSRGEYVDTMEVQPGDWLISVGDYYDGTDTYTLIALVDNNQDDRYLSKSGGTVDGNLSVTGNLTGMFDVRGYSSKFEAFYLRYDDGTETVLGPRLTTDGGLNIYVNSQLNPDNKYKLLHEGNESSLKVAEADKWSSSFELSLTGDASGSISFDGNSTGGSLSVTATRNNSTKIGTTEPSDDVRDGDIFFDTST